MDVKISDVIIHGRTGVKYHVVAISDGVLPNRTEKQTIVSACRIEPPYSCVVESIEVIKRDFHK